MKYLGVCPDTPRQDTTRPVQTTAASVHLLAISPTAIQTNERNKKAARTKVGNAILALGLEHEGEGVALVLGLEGHDVVVAGALEDLGHVGGVEAEGDGTVAPEMVEAGGAEGDGHEGHVGGVHGLDGQLILGAVDVGVLDEVLDGFNEGLEDAALGESGFEHGEE